MSRGSAATEVAWLYPEWEADNFPNFGVEPGANESETGRALRRAGFSYARVSRSALAASSSVAGALQVGEASFEALLVEGVHALDPPVLLAVQRALDAGVVVVWIGDFPDRATGLVDAEARDAMVKSLVDELQSGVAMVSAIADIPVTLARAGVLPSLSPVTGDGLRMSVARRRVLGGDIYFVFNESYEERTDEFRIEGAFAEARLFDPETGRPVEMNIDGDLVRVTLPGAHGIVLLVVRRFQ